MSVGSVGYNAPELWELEYRLAELRQRGHDPREADSLRYDGVKADMFSAAVTLFLLKLKFQPFRRAHANDPYYKKLAFKSSTKYFWKIYSSVTTSAAFKDVFERLICHKPEDRSDTSTVLNHDFLDNADALLTDDVKSEILAAFKNVENVLGDSSVPPTDETSGATPRKIDPEREDWERNDEQEFEKLRCALIAEVHVINKSLRKRRYIKHFEKHE